MSHQVQTQTATKPNNLPNDATPLAEAPAAWLRRGLFVYCRRTKSGGTVKTYQRNGKELVNLGTSDNGGLVYVYNKTGQRIAEMIADDYGNGLVGAWDRKGMGRTLESGP
ncbi:hypothetical protein OAF45_03530 [Candidatus Latescibacteria bacterium]|nr:hypothetical protein [Candidatus Latescibacterota bacterium]